MPCSNTAALDRYETDEFLRSHYDRDAERKQDIADRRENRRFDLLESVDELDRAIYLNLDYGDLKQLLRVFVPQTGSDVFSAVARDDAARSVIAQLVESVLDVEEKLGNFG